MTRQTHVLQNDSIDGEKRAILKEAELWRATGVMPKALLAARRVAGEKAAARDTTERYNIAIVDRENDMWIFRNKIQSIGRVDGVKGGREGIYNNLSTPTECCQGSQSCAHVLCDVQ